MWETVSNLQTAKMYFSGDEEVLKNLFGTSNKTYTSGQLPEGTTAAGLSWILVFWTGSGKSTNLSSSRLEIERWLRVQTGPVYLEGRARKRFGPEMNLIFRWKTIMSKIYDQNLTVQKLMMFQPHSVAFLLGKHFTESFWRRKTWTKDLTKIYRAGRHNLRIQYMMYSTSSNIFGSLGVYQPYS